MPRFTSKVPATMRRYRRVGCGPTSFPALSFPTMSFPTAAGSTARLSKLQGGDRLVLVLSRGGFRPSFVSR